ncbi:MAG: hypothetical protein ACRC6A_06305 [Fusobacteriaceae bacterium]
MKRLRKKRKLKFFNFILLLSLNLFFQILKKSNIFVFNNGIEVTAI